MTSTDDPTTIRLTGRRGLLAVIPSMLGFHPQESLVMVCLTGPSRRVGPVIRLDLDQGAGGSDPVSSPSAQLRFLARRHADEVAIVCYTELPDTPPVVYDLLDALAGDATTVLDVVAVGRGRVRSAIAVLGGPPPGGREDDDLPDQDPDDPDDELLCDDLTGHELDPMDDDDADPADDPRVRLAAAGVLLGRAVLPDRDALRRSVAGPTGPAGRRALAGMQSAADRLLAAIGNQGPLDRARLDELADRTVPAALLETATANGIGQETAALIALLLCDVDIRDRVIVRAVRELDTPWVPMLIAVATAVPDQDAAEVCGVLSVAAYRRGDGALAQVAVDRALAAEPEHRLSHLMIGVMAAGMPPEDLVDLATDELLSR